MAFAMSQFLSHMTFITHPWNTILFSWPGHTGNTWIWTLGVLWTSLCWWGPLSSSAIIQENGISCFLKESFAFVFPVLQLVLAWLRICQAKTADYMVCGRLWNRTCLSHTNSLIRLNICLQNMPLFSCHDCWIQNLYSSLLNTVLNCLWDLIVLKSLYMNILCSMI